MNRIFIGLLIGCLIGGILVQYRFTGNILSNKPKLELWYQGNGYYWTDDFQSINYIAKDECLYAIDYLYKHANPVEVGSESIQ